VACRPSYVYYYCCYKCCSKCCKCYELALVSIQSSYTFASKCKGFSPSKNLVSCSLLTSWLCSLSFFSCGDVIYGISCLYSLSCVSCGVGIYGIFSICLVACAIVGTTNGSTLPFIIFCALKFMLSYSLSIPKLKVPPSSTLLFLLRTLIGEFAITFFLFSNVVCISS